MHQEREVTDISEAAVEHQGPDIFIINTAAFHNAHLLRRVLPRDLIRPIPANDTTTRERLHHQHAAKLRATSTKKRKEREVEAEKKTIEAAVAREKAQQLEKEAAEAMRAAAEGEGPPAQRVRFDEA